MLSWIRSKDIDIFREEMILWKLDLTEEERRTITNLKKVMLKILAQPKEKQVSYAPKLPFEGTHRLFRKC